MTDLMQPFSTKTNSQSLSSWGTNTWSLFARQGGESLQPGHSRSERSNSSDTDFEGQIWHRQSGHSGTGTCCVFACGRVVVGYENPRQDNSPPATFQSGNLSEQPEGAEAPRRLYVGGDGDPIGAAAEWVASTRNPQPPASSSLLPGLSTTSFSPPTTPFTWLVVRQQPTTVLYTQQCVF
eukprot:COSAG02_NODE_3770_length_6258_cov_2588.033447_2_plen_180_part_00